MADVDFTGAGIAEARTDNGYVGQRSRSSISSELHVRAAFETACVEAGMRDMAAVGEAAEYFIQNLLGAKVKVEFPEGTYLKIGTMD